MDSPQEENVLKLCGATKEEDCLLSASTGFFEEEFDDDDEVFLDDSQSVDMETSLNVPTRLRRTSDVIDCVGETTSSTHVKRHSFPSTSSETIVYSATSKATNIVQVNRSRRAELTTESLDLGYSSPGAPFSSRSTQGSWFKFSTSKNADSIDAKPLTIK